ncbi:MAG TPA: 3-hydroxyacyl-CoA dehydrogenase NAD-binding domain-containing protein, partial [Pyrinomonadaceae bacterium]|nr:3-hydroxyacyl-CoA dehydrogenase NAD-binding domain-containing protein [Pyrinomonadaceae bacterium]
MRLVGVVGAGVMGSGLAQALAQTGTQVLLVDVSEAVLDKAKAGIKQNLRFQRMFGKRDDVPATKDPLSL